MKNKSCKFVIIAAAAAMLLAGCGSDAEQQNPVMQGGTTSAVTTAATTIPTTVPTVAPTTTVPATTTTAPTTAPYDATGVPSEATVTTTTPTTVTTVAPTTTKPTTASTTVSATACQHTYGQLEVIKAATCTQNGYLAARCSKCGQESSDNAEIIPKLGHKYGEWTSNNDATCEKDGSKTRKCERCGTPESISVAGTKLGHNWIYDAEKSYAPPAPAICGRNYFGCSRCSKTTSTPIYMDDAMIEQYCREVEQVILSELNRYRVEIGQEPLVYLPGLSEVCQYRAYQIHEKSGQDVHNDNDINAAFTKFEYGVYVDAVKEEQWAVEHIPGYVPKDVTEADNYWTPGGTEAVNSLYGSVYQTAEERGIDAMEGLRNSAGHWSYLGSDLYSYVGIGVYCGTNGIYTNIWVCSTNYE